GPKAQNYTYSAYNGQADLTHLADQGLQVVGDLNTNGGNIQLDAGFIEMHGHTINTGSPTGAGNITFTAKTITIDDGAQLLAKQTTNTTGAQGGTILLNAINDRSQVTGVPLAGNASVNLNKPSVTIGAATIEGADVQVLATASSTVLVRPSDFGNVPGLSTA